MPVNLLDFDSERLAGFLPESAKSRFAPAR